MIISYLCKIIHTMQYDKTFYHYREGSLKSPRALSQKNIDLPL